MIAWSDDLWQSVVLLTANEEGRRNKFGTGFVLCVDGRAAWVVTCAHVLDQLGQADAILVNNRPARLAGKRHLEIDLAVLYVPDLADVQPLALTTTTIPGSSAWIPGWHSVDKDIRRRDALAATLGRKFDFSATGETIQRTFDLVVQGFADDTLLDVDRREKVIHPGYSGAPVLCPSRRAVLAVASMEKEEGEAAYAVSVEHLSAVWPDDAPPIPWLDVPAPILDPDVCQFLGGVLGSLPEGLSLDDLKRHCSQCGPPGLPLNYPPVDDPAAFLYWLIEAGELSNHHVPLHDVLMRIEPALDDEPKRQRLRDIRAAIAARYPDIDRSEPDTTDASGMPIGLEIELIEPPAGSKLKRYDVKVGLTTAGASGAQVVDVREGRDDERLRPDDDEEVGALLHWLLSQHVPSSAFPERFTFTFRLPRHLIDTPVDRWRATDGDPLGIEFPVIVQDADRRAGDVVPMHWSQSWEALVVRLEELFPAPLRWCDGDSKANDQTRACARQGRREGAVIALTCPGDPEGQADAGLLNYLLKHLGASVILWPQHPVDPKAFRAGLEGAFAGYPLRSAAQCALELRREREDHPERSDAAAHFTLLWDPFHEEPRPRLFGSD